LVTDQLKDNPFIHEGKWTVAHGGVSIEEFVVPFIQIEIDANEEATQREEKKCE